MDLIQHRLLSLRDTDYAAFQAKLIPTIDPARVIGIRIPQLRQLAKEFKDEPQISEFMNDLPHHYYDENMLHGLIINEIRGFEDCITAVEKFLPYIDNWAVCDSLRPAVFKKNRANLLPYVLRWMRDKHIYTCRYALVMLLTHYLEEEFKPEFLETVASIDVDEYYINMAIAWFYATALAKQWDATIPYLEQRRLTPWIHNKTIQKARESRLFTSEQKTYILSLK